MGLANSSIPARSQLVGHLRFPRGPRTCPQLYLAAVMNSPKDSHQTITVV